MITAISHVACRVRDLEASLGFYRDVLDLTESYRLSHANGDTELWQNTSESLQSRAMG
jgi:catechol 2,3-dioxygenase-like lactoylglutathione lyase family enzyme